MPLRDRLLSLIQSCTKTTHLLQIHAHILRTHSIFDGYVSSQFLSRVSRNVGYCRLVLSQIQHPSLLHYNTMIRAYSTSDSPEEGIFMYREMQRQGLRPDPMTGSFVIKSCARLQYLEGGLQVHGRILRDGHQLDGRLLTTLMDFYSVCGWDGDACKVFDEITLKDTVSWNVLISCYLRNKRKKDALEVFDAMLSPGCACKPDDVTCLHLLQACADLNALEFGEKVHNYIVDHGYDRALNLCNSLIAMYSRCGRLDKAYDVAKGMTDKNIVSWTAWISGLAMNGHERDAITAFQEMLGAGVFPEAQTFTAVLSACSRCGMVDEGMMIFDSMSKQYGINPTVHHYGCIVDLLGRAGLLDRAYEMIVSMPMKPDSTVWRTLLGACRIHGHVTLGERVVDHLIEQKAQEAGDYVLLLNIYSTVGNWEKVIEIRKLMKERGIQTTPGCSTIEHKGVVHEFTVDDTSHPRNPEIYAMLDEIGQQLRIAGYVPEISSEMHNLSVEEKGYRLCYHSEKLAIAFGVLVTPPGTPIRVANNLRICIDCHNFAKVLSSTYSRDVVIRDRTRSHHFRGGVCSCNDYW